MAIFRKSSAAGDDAHPGTTGPARLVRADADLVAGLRPGDIAVIDRADLDRADADRLIGAGVVAVINLASSATGRFPNLGPQSLAQAQITHVDQVGPGITARIRSGDRLRVHDGKIFRDGVLVASGVSHDVERAAADLSAASSDLTTSLDILAANAADHLRREHAMLLEGVRVPTTRTAMKERPVVLVSDTFDAATDLAGLKQFIRDRDPVLIGAGRGADVLLQGGFAPTIAIGDIEELSAEVIRRSHEVVVTTSSGQIANPERLERHGSDVTRFVAAGPAADLAIVLADSGDASVIVHAGAAPSLVDFLGQGSGLLGSAFVVRLRAAQRLVDAKAVAHLSAGPPSSWPLLVLALAGLSALAVAIGITPGGSDLYASLGDQFADLRSWIEGLL